MASRRCQIQWGAVLTQVIAVSILAVMGVVAISVYDGAVYSTARNAAVDQVVLEEIAELRTMVMNAHPELPVREKDTSPGSLPGRVAGTLKDIVLLKPLRASPKPDVQEKQDVRDVRYELEQKIEEQQQELRK
jgi:hypothetical protein